MIDLEWIPTTDYHHKPQDLETILFVLSNCPYTGETNRVHCGYVIHGKDYESSEWYSWEFHGYAPVTTDKVVAWMPMLRYEE